MKPALSIYKGILNELRLRNLQNPIRADITAYLSKEFKKHKVTGDKLCQANESASFYAKTYLEMLRSSRLHQGLVEQYKGKGERTTEESRISLVLL